ncbi:GntR family transcriptional regulator [Bacillus piscicola]|uniref:GntR family transcriptional regulator n=1 Tax=Bacillus piscicola TaxID=1632684 RepID=UPI001F090DE7|nr:GntR family transcriptional regulator [Bacillus piscicola]
MTQKKLNKSKHAYNVIRARILDGTYAPGQRIILDQIAKEVGSSHIPVREAIRRLEADQLIEYKPNAGAVVLSFDEKVYKETLELLGVLEGYATNLSVPHMKEADIEVLETINNEMNEALMKYDLNTFSDLNKKFHFAIYSRCPNKLLIQNIEQSWGRLDTVRKSGFSFFPMRAPESVKEHAQLIELIKDKASAEKIESFTRQHKLNTLTAYQNRV